MKACARCFRLFAEPVLACTEPGCAGARLIRAGNVEIAPHPEDPNVGRLLLGRYRLFRIIADGGTARVYAALDESQQRQVALKVIHPELASDAVVSERFRREFRAGSQLQHPQIVELLDFQTGVDGRQVLVMEFLQGEELRALLRRVEQLPALRVVPLLSQVALAVDFAHARNWVHRDLKPDNLFICNTPEGQRTKVLDFGSVKDSSGASAQLTLLGTVLGSPFYMSPEQAQGRAIDGRTDVWSLAVIAYECLTGSVPFSGTNAPSILLKILGEAPEPPSQLLQLEPAVGAALDAVFAAGLAKAASGRPESAGSFVDALGAAFGFSGSHTLWASATEAELARFIRAHPAQPPPLSWLAGPTSEPQWPASQSTTRSALASVALQAGAAPQLPRAQPATESALREQHAAPKHSGRSARLAWQWWALGALCAVALALLVFMAR